MMNFLKLWWLTIHQGFLIASFSFYVLIISRKIFFFTCVVFLNYATLCHHKKAMNVLSNGLFLLVEPL